VKNIERGDAELRDTILEQIDEGMRVDARWGTFAGQFNHAHHDFCAVLARLHPELTPTELKVCGFIHLGLSSKEIAGLLHIAVRTVEIHRGHIRKRLCLPQNHSLALFLKSISGEMRSSGAH
jgi:DNA-binding NarL/FixJ family response regulator